MLGAVCNSRVIQCENLFVLPVQQKTIKSLRRRSQLSLNINSYLILVVLEVNTIKSLIAGLDLQL